jgi:hypothetical protein
LTLGQDFFFKKVWNQPRHGIIDVVVLVRAGWIDGASTADTARGGRNTIVPFLTPFLAMTSPALRNVIVMVGLVLLGLSNVVDDELGRFFCQGLGQTPASFNYFFQFNILLERAGFSAHD